MYNTIPEIQHRLLVLNNRKDAGKFDYEGADMDEFEGLSAKLHFMLKELEPHAI